MFPGLANLIPIIAGGISGAIGSGASKQTDSNSKRNDELDASTNSGLTANQTTNVSSNQNANQASNQSQTQSNFQNQSSTVNAGNATLAELLGQQGQLDAFNQLRSFSNNGAGQADITNYNNSQNSLAAMLQQYATQGGSDPTSADISNANRIASNIFAPQQTALNQSFVDQTNSANRQAALLGRSINDPILQAKLRTEQIRQNQMLQANQGVFAQNYALQEPMQRLTFANQHASVLGGLASQAMNNRMQLAAMGNSIMDQERNFRLATAARQGVSSNSMAGNIFGNTSSVVNGSQTGFSNAIHNGFSNSHQRGSSISSGSNLEKSTSGGGLGGAINGILGGLGSAASTEAGIKDIFNGSSSRSGGAPPSFNYGQGPSGNFFGLGK